MWLRPYSMWACSNLPCSLALAAIFFLTNHKGVSFFTDGTDATDGWGRDMRAKTTSSGRMKGLLMRPIQFKLLWPSESWLLPEVEFQNVLSLEKSLIGLHDQWVSLVPCVFISLDKNSNNTINHLAHSVLLTTLAKSIYFLCFFQDFYKTWIPNSGCNSLVLWQHLFCFWPLLTMWNVQISITFRLKFWGGSL